MFRAGDWVQVKTYEDIKNKWGDPDSDGQINVRRDVFTPEMGCLSGIPFKIVGLCGEVVYGLNTVYNITQDMIEYAPNPNKEESQDDWQDDSINDFLANYTTI